MGTYLVYTHTNSYTQIHIPTQNSDRHFFLPLILITSRDYIISIKGQPITKIRRNFQKCAKIDGKIVHCTHTMVSCKMILYRVQKRKIRTHTHIYICSLLLTLHIKFLKNHSYRKLTGVYNDTTNYTQYTIHTTVYMWYFIYLYVFISPKWFFILVSVSYLDSVFVILKRKKIEEKEEYEEKTPTTNINNSNKYFEYLCKINKRCPNLNVNDTHINYNRVNHRYGISFVFFLGNCYF